MKTRYYDLHYEAKEAWDNDMVNAQRERPILGIVWVLVAVPVGD